LPRIESKLHVVKPAGGENTENIGTAHLLIKSETSNLHAVPKFKTKLPFRFLRALTA